MSDWTCRVLVAELQPAREYWYRFVDEGGNGSRIGRTLTAPGADDPRPAKFALVSCQSLPEGAMNAYRKMIFEDEKAAPDERIGFVLHLGDFVYEVVQYPEQVKNGKRYDRIITFPPTEKLSLGDKSVANYVAGAAPQTMLGRKQKAWFLERLRSANATWKIWGNSFGTLDRRVDPQNLPPALGKWQGKGYGITATGDWGGMYHERAEIFDAVRDAGITGFAIVAGDRHSFWAGYAAKALPPAAFEPVGVSFVGGSVISPGMAEANEHNQKKENNPTRGLYIAEDRDGKSQCAIRTWRRT